MSKSVLVIDDEPKISELCRDYLRAAGYSVLTAADGPLRLALARRERPDLVVLDLMLPGMDRLDVCRELRRERSPSKAMSAPSIRASAICGASCKPAATSPNISRPSTASATNSPNDRSH